LFWLDGPSVNGASPTEASLNGSPQSSQAADTLLGWNQHRFWSNYTTFHQPLPPEKADQEALCAYIRDSILFWEDPCHPPPQPAAASAAFTNPFHG
jgi:hypothetical protein